MEQLLHKKFEDLYGELLVIDGKEVEFLEPKLIEWQSDYYEVDKRVAKKVMSGIGIKSEYFSRRLYNHDVEIWNIAMDKALYEEGGQYFLEDLNFVATDEVISTYQKEEEYDFKRLVNKIIDYDKEKYYQVNNFRLDVIFKEDNKIIAVTTHPNEDIRLYTGIEDNGRLYLYCKPDYKENIKKEEELDFFNLDFDEFMDDIEPDSLKEFFGELYSVTVSLEELFNLMGNIGLLPKNTEKLEEFSDVEKRIASEVITYIDNNFESYAIAKDIHEVKRIISLTKYSIGDILYFYTELLFEGSDKVQLSDILNLAEKVADRDLVYIHLGEQFKWK